MTPLDIARRVIAEHAAGNTEFKAADAFVFDGITVSERAAAGAVSDE